MENVALKLVASPLLIWAASLVGRRWGQSVAGWLVGLPLTTGPVIFFLALDYGTDFAARAAVGSLAGTAVQAGFCLAYARVARGCGWPIALIAATIAFVLGAILYDLAAPPPPVLLPIVLTALASALFLLPRSAAEARVATVPPPWDIPARMIIAAGLVLGLSSAAPVIGPRLAGLIAAYPVFATGPGGFRPSARRRSRGLPRIAWIVDRLVRVRRVLHGAGVCAPGNRYSRGIRLRRACYDCRSRVLAAADPTAA